MAQGGSIFDILGPVMVGPSSSHTAGAVRLALMCRDIAGDTSNKKHIIEAEFLLYNSFAHTYKGHGTDRGLAAGILGYAVDDPTIRNVLSQMQEDGSIPHPNPTHPPVRMTFTPVFERNNFSPNTVKFKLKLSDGENLEIVGHSIGGGKVYVSRINGYNVTLRGEAHTLLLFYKDQPGMIWQVTKVIAERHINIATLTCSRRQRGVEAFMNITLDSPIPSEALDEIATIADIHSIRSLNKLPD